MPIIDRSCTASETPAGEESSVARGNLRGLLQSIVIKMISGDGDNGLIDKLMMNVETDVAKMDEEERTLYYDKVRDIFTVFFGIEQTDEACTTEMIRALIRVVFPDLFNGCKDIEYISGDKMRVLKERINNEMHRLITESQKIEFDMHDFVNNILFEGKETMDLEVLSTRFSSIEFDIPLDIAIALSKVLAGMKSKRIPSASKKVIANALKQSRNHDAKERVSDPKVARLKELLAFIESLEKRKMCVTDFYILDYLKDFVDANIAVSLVGAQSHTLANAVVESRYNGNHLASDAFTRHARNEAISKAIISSISKRDFEDVASCLIRMVKGELEIENLNIRTGIGASSEDVPLRILSYVIPSLTIARRFKQKYGKSPNIDFFTGQEGGIACNGMPADIVRRNTQTAFQIIHDFVNVFFPDISERFSLVGDKEWSYPKIKLMVGYLEEILIEEAKKATDYSLTKIVNELKRRGGRYGSDRGEENALKYAAFHVICFRDVPIINTYIDEGKTKESHIVSIGGSSEAEYDYVRGILTEKFSVDGFNDFARRCGQYELVIETTVPPLETRSSLLIDTGVIPPYFLVKETGDIGVEELEGLELDQIGKLFADRVRRALTIMNRACENDARMKAGAKSFVQDMALIASAIGRDPFIGFIHQSSNAK